jgi:hypothetical protein
LSEVENTYKIKCIRHPKYNNLVLFKYNLVASPIKLELVIDCRGIILDAADNWAVVSMAFRKFTTYNPAVDTPLDWTTATVQEKVDGSLCVLYTYDGAWHVATSGVPDGSGEIEVPQGPPTTFAALFWSTFAASNFTLPPPDRSMCYYLELTGPLNRVIVEHAAPRLTVLGCRRLSSLDELPAATAAAALGAAAAAVRTFPLRSPEDITATFARMNPLEQEGYVVVDAAWNRVKVKHPGYVALHLAGCLAGLRQPRVLADIARKMEAAEVIASFPSLEAACGAAARRHEALVAAVEADWARLAPLASDARAFALEAVRAPWAALLFHLRSGRSGGVREFLAGMRLDGYMALFDSDRVGAREATSAAGLAMGPS